VNFLVAQMISCYNPFETKERNLIKIYSFEKGIHMKAISNKGFGNGKATMDNGYGMFQNMLTYKLAERGKHLVVVDKWYPSSQICHCCGHRQPMPLKIRVYQCQECGMVCDRDLNAAINIKMEGLRLLSA